MKKMIGVVAVLALCLATIAPAQAGGYGRGYGHHGYKGHGYGHHGYRHHGYKRHRDYTGAYVALGVIGGALLLGTLLSRPSYAAAPAYTPPPPVRQDCQPTTGTGYLNGRLATFGGTWCRDAYGNGYVVPGSEYFIGYTQ